MVNSYNLRARLLPQEAPTNLKQKLKSKLGKLKGGQKVYALEGTSTANTKFSVKIKGAKVAANQKQFDRMMQDHALVPISTKDIRSRDEAGTLQPGEVIFVKVDDLAQMKLNVRGIKNALSAETTDLRVVRAKVQLFRALDSKVFWETLKDDFIDKSSQPIEADTLQRADQALHELPKIKLTSEQRENLIEARTGGSNTISENPAKKNDWLRAEQFMLELVDSDNDLTMEDLFKLNSLMNGDENDEIGGGELRDHETSRGGFGGPHYIGKDDVEPMMKGLLDYINNGIKKGENPIVLAAKAYQQMVSIHPFSDGNGRTCRLVMDLLLIKAGLPPPSLKNEEINVAIFGKQHGVEYMPEEVTPTEAVNVLLTRVQRTYDSIS